MQWKDKLMENRRDGLKAALLTSILGMIFLFYTPIGDWSYDLPYAFRPETKPTDVVIVYMDEQTEFKLFGKPIMSLWPREIHAQLLRVLKDYGVNAVAFDVIFHTNTQANADYQLAEAAKSFGKVVMAAKVWGDSGVRGIARPYDELSKSAPWGIVEEPDRALFLRKHYVGDPYFPQYPSLAWRLAELTKAKALGDRFKPMRWVNYYGPPGTIPGLSYINVLSNNVPLTELSNKVVFVGALIYTGFRPGKGTDDWKTPYTHWEETVSPGVELNATVYLNLLHDEWLRRCPLGWELLLCLATGFLFGWGLLLLRPLRAAVMGVMAMLAVFAIACLVAWNFHVWFDWLAVNAVQIPCAVGCAVLFHTQKLLRDKQALEARLATITPAAQLASSQDAKTVSDQPLPAQTPVLQPAHPVYQLHRSGSHPSQPMPAAATPASPPPIPDHTLLKRIGAGAYGEVWVARSIVGSHHGVKIIYRQNFREDRPYEREFEGIRHYEPISRNHPGLLHILHVGRNHEAGYYFCVMELADDVVHAQEVFLDTYKPKTLSSLMTRGHKLPPAECLQIGLNLSDALGYLHERGLIHRDIKPANIVFVDGKPKLADIGLVTSIGENVTFVGTEGFYPPEGPGSPAADIFSLGKVLYEMATGFNRTKFPELPSGFFDGPENKRTRGLNQVIMKACEPEARKRYQSAKVLHADLWQLQSSAELKQKPAAPRPRKAGTPKPAADAEQV